MTPGHGLERISNERIRQITAEGWTAEHDDMHVAGELAIAGACYAALAMHQTVHPTLDIAVVKLPAQWPWEPKWWKPSADRIRNLEKAGALIAAEIDRLKREEKRHGS